ncbi:hypothetical protein E4T43_05285 [Aureobasidium subglaciale]|nr:hypothetical protein E4T43_05285 [Aureobasidium subglaciale]
MEFRRKLEAATAERLVLELGFALLRRTGRVAYDFGEELCFVLFNADDFCQATSVLGDDLARHESYRASLIPLLPGEEKCSSFRISHKAMVIVLSIALTALATFISNTKHGVIRNMLYNVFSALPG